MIGKCKAEIRKTDIRLNDKNKFEICLSFLVYDFLGFDRDLALDFDKKTLRSILKACEGYSLSEIEGKKIKIVFNDAEIIAIGKTNEKLCYFPEKQCLSYEDICKHY